MAGFDSLINKRTSIRGRLTKFKNYLAQVESIVEESQYNEVQLKLQKFTELSHGYDLLQDNIDELCPDTIDDEIDERDATESQFTQSLAKAKTILKQYSNSNVQTFLTQSDSQRSHGASFKLPTIVISTFDGNYSNWLEFRDTYKSLIHNNSQLLPIHKFHYLNSYLTGEAARLLTNLEVSSETYGEAWDLLCARFNNKRHLINNHLNALFSLEPITRENDKSIRSLVDNINKDLRALSSLGEPVDKWDTIIIHMVCMKLDHTTKRAWEEVRNTFEDMPTLSQLTKFLQDRAGILETCIKRINTISTQQVPLKNVHAYRSMTCTTNSSVTPVNVKKQTKAQSTCTYCSEDHVIYNCPTFLAKTPAQRHAEVFKLHLCVNCLKRGHNARECHSSSCRQCRKRHNTLLHIPTQPGANNSVQTATTTAADSPVVANIASSQPTIQVLLSTAVIEVVNTETNKRTKARCLLDSGSQTTFISKSLKDRLGLKSTQTKAVPIMGMSNTPCGFILERSVVCFKSTTGNFNVTQACAVIPKLTGKIPHKSIDMKYLNLPSSIQLADPMFYSSSPVEILIGADLFWLIIRNEQRSLGPNLPILRNSQFGWLIAGPLCISGDLKQINCQLVTSNQDHNSRDILDQKLSRFWELEELPKRPLFSDSEKMCEAHFQSHTTRQDNGRFCVRLPFKKPPSVLGDSYQLARQRFLSLERKFRKNPTLKKAYCNFIDEYKHLGHCAEMLNLPKTGGHYLCHHAVLSDRSESTKLRVVFDGSAATTSGLSINDIQFTGPKVQDALLFILLRFRIYKYALAGDIDKFFRQILIHEDDRDLQLILWREEPTQLLKTFKLNTVTYGFTRASYLSTKCLWLLAQECSDNKIKEIIQNDFYCDDLLTGANTKEELLYILNSVIAKLKSGCFNLRKFRSNAPEIFPMSTLDLQANLSLSDATSALGLGWSPPADILQFTIQSSTDESASKSTKRSILSSSFSIFDPLGLLAPCTVQPKLLLQQLWQRGLNWDELVPEDLQKTWHKIRGSFPILSALTIPRRVLCDEPSNIQLHSFSDASMHAYGACIYLRSTNKDGDVTVQLLCAKSRVAPTKPLLTIPKLELLGALLAANLTKTVLESLRCPISSCVHWCDSSVVLAWLNNSPSKLKSFVANKVVEICEYTNLTSWRYVPTASNPADYISRGVSPEKLLELQEWWSGPSYLTMDDTHWPVIAETNQKNTAPETQLPEMKVLSIIQADDNQIIEIENYSQLNRLTRILAYVLRFIHNLKNKNAKSSDSLSVSELHKSFSYLSRQSQRESFPKEYNALGKGLQLAASSKITSLSPFLDENGVMRVGGRLDKSSYSYNKKHPIILDGKHKLTKLIFEREHLRQLHGGPQLILYSIRQTIWPIGARQVARSTVRACVVCRRHKGQTLTPLMGNLPSERITPAFPFQTIGLDFAGPFNIINKKGRGARVSKCYLCLFICFRYKCVHLEAVSDLSMEAFILALRRLISRRGIPQEIYCDNGRNFVAASKQVGQFIKKNAESFLEFASTKAITFKFQPPYAPHFSGLSEAGIKSAKHLVKRVMGNSHLTFEELSTLFAQVEAIMNSRPLSPLSSTPDDYLPLSPGHFLIGRPLTSLPSDDTSELQHPCRTRYELLQKIRQQFWKRWQKDYISELQERKKWKRNKSSLAVGDLVLIQEDNTRPLDWRLGRVAQIFPGDDGIPRVADISTTRGTIRRALTRLCPLLDEPGPEHVRA